MKINYREIDKGIRPMVALLSRHGIVTVTSCEGHEAVKLFSGRPWVEIDVNSFYLNGDRIVFLKQHIHDMEIFWRFCTLYGTRKFDLMSFGGLNRLVYLVFLNKEDMPLYCQAVDRWLKMCRR